MNLYVPDMRDRRVAASDESHSSGVHGGSRRPIFGEDSPARRAADAAGVRFDLRRIRTARDPGIISTVILHQTAVASVRSLPPVGTDQDIASEHVFDHMIAHFVVCADGTLVYTHDIGHILNDAGGRFGIDIEFEGDFGNDPEPAEPRLGMAAIQAGRRLLLWLDGYLPSLSHIHPHGQVQRGAGGKLHSCCGPDIWMNVGEWAVRRLGWTCDTPVGTYPNHGISPRQRNAAYDRQLP
jgi:hypothetical protein